MCSHSGAPGRQARQAGIPALGDSVKAHRSAHLSSGWRPCPWDGVHSPQKPWPAHSRLRQGPGVRRAALVFTKLTRPAGVRWRDRAVPFRLHCFALIRSDFDTTVSLCSIQLNAARAIGRRNEPFRQTIRSRTESLQMSHRPSTHTSGIPHSRRLPCIAPKIFVLMARSQSLPVPVRGSARRLRKRSPPQVRQCWLAICR